MIRIKRTYDPPTRNDGHRFLVERLWPRGMKKESLQMDAWLKDVAPSTPLRQWFGHRPERWDEFRRRYRQELTAHPEAWKPLLATSKKGAVTLLYSAHDTERNGAIVLQDFLVARERRRSSKSTRSPRAHAAHKSTAQSATAPSGVAKGRKAGRLISKEAKTRITTDARAAG